MEKLKVRDIIDMIKKDSVESTCKHLEQKKLSSTSYKTLQSQVASLFNKYKKLNKSQSTPCGKLKLEEFLDTSYRYPDPKSYRVENSSKLNRSLPFHKFDNFDLQNDVYKNVAESLADELKYVEEKNKELNEELEKSFEENNELNESLDKSLEKIEHSKKSLKRTAGRETYYREKASRLENIENESPISEHDELKYLREQIKKKDSEIKSLKLNIDDLVNNIDKYKSVQEGIFFDEETKSYKTNLHNCVYELLNYQVSCENIPNVIKSVCKLVNVKPNKLPHPRTISNWSLERSIIARRHIADMSDKCNTTLYTDETSKYGQKWGAFANRDNEGNYMLLGLREMATKSSADTLDTFKDILSDIDNSIPDNSEAGVNILTNIRNTMSDRAGTEMKFNVLLKQYREEILPKVYENYNELNLDSQQALTRMNNFFCGLHTLVHMADISQKSLFDIEQTFFDDNVPINNKFFKKSGQSGTVRCIMTACKAFARRGDQKSGCHHGYKIYISNFLKENNLLSLPLEPLRGNRFNILFSNAGHVYFLKDTMIEYLTKCSALNGLLESVLFDLKTDFFISGCKALGLISKLITTPLWRVMENKDISISDMNHHYARLLVFLNESVDDLECFMKGDLILFQDVSIKKDIIYHKLVSPSVHDDQVKIILAIVLPAIGILIKHQYKDHLPGGIHEHIDSSQTKSVDKHNKFPERVFSYVDHILKTKPNISTMALEAQISFSLNKTSEWLNEQPNKEEIIKNSRAEVKRERERFKKRSDEIMRKRIEKQEEDFRKKEEQEKRRILKLEQETIDMSYYGLWQNADQVEEELGKIQTEKEKVEALKVQLRFRKNVFKQTGPNSNTYSFSKIVNGKRQNLSSNELKQNVNQLVNMSLNSAPLDQPHWLVSKTIQHKFKDDDNSETFKWYTGKVISQVPGFPDWFNIVYEDDDAVYTAKLSTEMHAGDVIVKSR